MWKDGQFTNSQGINYKLTYSKPLLQYQIDKKFNSHNSKYWWKGKPLKLFIFFFAELSLAIATLRNSLVLSGEVKDAV